MLNKLRTQVRVPTFRVASAALVTCSRVGSGQLQPVTLHAHAAACTPSAASGVKLVWQGDREEMHLIVSERVRLETLNPPVNHHKQSAGLNGICKGLLSPCAVTAG